MPKRLHDDDDEVSLTHMNGDGTGQIETGYGISAPSPAKFVQMNDEDYELGNNRNVVMECDLPPHRSNVQFTSYKDYEHHYHRVHMHVCMECHRVFPSKHYMELHISEHHDPIMEAKRARGEKTYGCFVEDCDRFCSTPQKRRHHVIDKHHFPKHYNFWVVKSGTNSRFRPGKEMYSRTAVAKANSFALSKNSTSNRRQSSSTVATTFTDETEGSPANVAAPEDALEENDDDSGEEEDEEEDHDMSQNSIPSETMTTVPGDVDRLTKSLDRLKVAQAKPKVKFGKGQRSGFLRTT